MEIGGEAGEDETQSCAGVYGNSQSLSRGNVDYSCQCAERSLADCDLLLCSPNAKLLVLGGQPIIC